jgi:hypothetical protein
VGLAQALSHCYNSPAAAFLHKRLSLRGQVAQLVERSPEKAGVGGSIPSLATIIRNNLSGSPASQLEAELYLGPTAVQPYQRGPGMKRLRY